MSFSHTFFIKLRLIKLLETSGENTKKIVLDFFKNIDVKGYQELIKDLQEAINIKIANEKESTIVFLFLQ